MMSLHRRVALAAVSRLLPPLPDRAGRPGRECTYFRAVSPLSERPEVRPTTSPLGKLLLLCAAGTSWVDDKARISPSTIRTVEVAMASKPLASAHPEDPLMAEATVPHDHTLTRKELIEKLNED